MLCCRDVGDIGEAVFADTISLYTHDAVHSVAVLVEWVVLYLAYFPGVQAEIQRLTDKVKTLLLRYGVHMMRACG